MKVFLKAVVALLCVFGLVSICQAQTTTITATHIYMGGVPIPSGTVTFTPVDTNGNPISFSMGGGGLNAPAAFPCKILFGAMSGTCVIPDASLTSPANIAYTVQVTNSITQKAFVLKAVLGIQGPTWALDTYGPPAQTTPVQPIQVSYGTAAAPNPCATPSFYIRNASGGQLYMCVAGAPVLVTGTGGASLPSTNSVLKGDGHGGALAATPGTDYDAAGAAAAAQAAAIASAASTALQKTGGTMTGPLAVADGSGKAGNFGLTAGTAPNAAPANTVQINAPASVTPYAITLPGAQPTAGNPFLSCTPANPSVCSFAPGSVNSYGGVNTFGDSITNGAGSTTYMQGGGGATAYAWQIINAYGGNGVNYGFGGDMAGDLAAKVTSQLNPKVSGNFLTTIMDSTNDVNVYGSSVPLQAVFTGALSDAIAWAAIPDVAKLQIANSPACTFTGTWFQAPDVTGGGLPAGIQGGGAFDNASGDHVSCTLTTFGTGPIYLSYMEVQSTSGWDLASNFTVTVDGGSATTFSPVSSVNIVTANGVTFIPVLGKIAGSFAAGPHTVLITNNHTGTSGGMMVFALMAPYPAGNNVTAPPSVFVGGTPWNQNNSPSTTTATYNSLIQTTVNGLASDGLNVHFVDIRSFLNSTSDYTGATLANGFVCSASTNLPFHPNDCGHAHLAQAFLASMPVPNISGPLPFLTYFGPIRSTSGGQGWVFGSSSAWQSGNTIIGGGCTNNCSFTGTGSAAAITTNSAAAGTALFKSTDSTNSNICITGTGAAVDLWCLLDVGSAVDGAGHAFYLGDFTPGIGIFSWKQFVNGGTGAGFIESPSLMLNCWSSVADITTHACDTGSSRGAPGETDFGNGTQGDKSGTIKAAHVIGSAGIGPSTTAAWTTGTVDPTGACSTGALYSNTSGAAGHVFWVCVASAWVNDK